MDWQRLAQTVIDRRVELGFRTREAFASETGLSSRLLGDIERAQRDNYDKATMARLEQALQWAPGTARHVLMRDHTAETIEMSLGPDGGPLQSRLFSLLVLAQGLPPGDYTRLLTGLDMTLEWIQAKRDETLTDEERIGPQFPMRPAPESREPVRPSRVAH